MATLANVLFCCRVALFAALIVCNTIVAGISGYNLGQPDAGHIAVAAYLFAVGLIGTLIPIPVVSCDLFRKNALVNHVWFECLWIGLLWVFELGGAIALTAEHATNLICAPNAQMTCTTFKVLEAFCWISSLFLLIYFVTLTSAAVYHQKDDKQVWRAHVRLYPWFEIRSALESSVESPTRKWQKPLQLNGAPASQTRQPPARKATLTRPSKLDVEHGIPPARAEYYSQPFSEKVESYYSAPRPAPVPQLNLQQVPQQAPSLYPEHLRSHLPPHSQAPAASEPASQPRRPTAHKQGSVGSTSSVSSTSSSRSGSWLSDPAGRPRPTHPTRKGSSGSARQRPIPPPLNLAAISAHRLIDERVSRR